MLLGTLAPHSRWHRRVAAVLLVIQASAGSAVTLAHAAEPGGGPVRFEAHHTTQCVVLHDTARCAQCQFTASHIAAPATRHTGWLTAAIRRPPVPRIFGQALAPERSDSARPRAPPFLLS
jgi:hypothetical protein